MCLSGLQFSVGSRAVWLPALRFVPMLTTDDTHTWESHSFGAEDKMIHSFSVLNDFGEESGLSWAT